MSKEQLQFSNNQVWSKDAARPEFALRNLLDEIVNIPETSALGEIVVRDDIHSLVHSPDGGLVPAKFKVLPEYKIQYPKVIVQALGKLYAEYNEAFGPLVEANREWGTDYQYCFAPSGAPINGWVQIDMVGLPDAFLREAPNFSETQVREALRGRIFEIENSLAMYQLLQRIFSYGCQDTYFNRQFRASLDNLRKRYGKPIALLAVTEQKYQAMRESEFGKREGEPLTDEEVQRLSGFDRFFSPDEFKEYLEQTRGRCDYLLYARTSDPVAKLKNPDLRVQVPLLEDDYTRRIIRKYAVTFNVDNPGWPKGDRKRINDTKAWMSALGMAYDIYAYEDVENEVMIRDERGKLKRVKRASEGLINYLISQGIDLQEKDPREITLRAKPMQASYGCYGHTRGSLTDDKFRQELRKGLRERGPYVLQPEMPVPVITNETDGQTYTYIDRNFMYTDGQGNYYYMGGFRSLMPINSIEASRGRNHGSIFTVWAEIT